VVLVFWDGLGEDGSEDLPVRFGAAAIFRRGVGVVVAIFEAPSAEVVASADETISATWIRTSSFFGFNGLSLPLGWGTGTQALSQ
jgi:hypothetical protein